MRPSAASNGACTSRRCPRWSLSPARSASPSVPCLARPVRRGGLSTRKTPSFAGWSCASKCCRLRRSAFCCSLPICCQRPLVGNLPWPFTDDLLTTLLEKGRAGNNRHPQPSLQHHFSCRTRRRLAAKCQPKSTWQSISLPPRQAESFRDSCSCASHHAPYCAGLRHPFVPRAILRFADALVVCNHG